MKDDLDQAPIITADMLKRGRRMVDVLSPKALAQFKRAPGRPKVDAPKVSVSICLDPDLLADLRSTGAGWQSRVNDILREAMAARRAAE